MAYTSAQLEALEAAMAEGVLTVEYADRRVTYRSLDEMRRLRDDIRSELGLASSGSRRYAQFSKGL